MDAYEFRQQRRREVQNAVDALPKGLSLDDIAARLNADGIKTLSGKPWTATTVAPFASSANSAVIERLAAMVPRRRQGSPRWRRCHFS